MENGGFWGRLNLAAEWLTQILYLDVLWLLFTLLGVVVAGFMPATAAAFGVTRKWVMGETDIPVFRTFWRIYRAEFGKANLLGWSLAAVAVVLYADYRFFAAHPGPVFILLRFAILVPAILWAVTALYAFPVFVQYDMRTGQVLKTALLIGLMNPGRTIIALVVVGGVVLFVRGVLPVVGAGLLVLGVMWNAYRAFARVDPRLQNQGEETG